MPERETDYSTRNGYEDYDYRKSRQAGDSKSYRSRNYSERHREEERHRDRERYDRKYDRRRRSASPKTQEPRGRERSPRPRSSELEDRSPQNNAKPNFRPSGLLAAETNTVKASDGTTSVLKYNEPPEARKPSLAWRLYVFKDSEQVELLHIHRQSAYLAGRDPLVADITLDHPSCSKQHAAIQYRYVQAKDEYGSSKGTVKPFIIDLESTNGTIVNQEPVPAARYYELKAGDVIKFGLSTREPIITSSVLPQGMDISPIQQILHTAARVEGAIVNLAYTKMVERQ